ncbi:hypothetical protein KNE206_31080 [Kitasatospora sp. NE20-6]|uniref:hypothetical protein n=1 Tax=Kitasatospora sp. NE20-6 TaxID=2859066 RepID=UPI0034DC76A1
MKNPFEDGSALARAIPWISIALVTGLATNATAADLPSGVKLLAWCATAAVAARSARQITTRRQRRKQEPGPLAPAAGNE